MNLTTDNTFDELEDAMRAVQFPCAPVRPTMLAYGKCIVTGKQIGRAHV